MKQALIVVALLSSSLVVPSLAAADAPVGAPAPAFALKDTHGKAIALADLKGKIVVLEWLNPNCPFVQRHSKEKTMSTLAKKHGGVVWLGINSTAKGHGDFMSNEALNAWAKDNGISYPVLVDSDSAVGKAYGAKTTPHLFVIGKDGLIAYSGAIDDDPSGKSTVAQRKNYVDQVLSNLSAGKAAGESTKPYGCSVKYGS